MKPWAWIATFCFTIGVTLIYASHHWYDAVNVTDKMVKDASAVGACGIVLSIAAAYQSFSLRKKRDKKDG